MSRALWLLVAFAVALQAAAYPGALDGKGFIDGTILGLGDTISHDLQLLTSSGNGGSGLPIPGIIPDALGNILGAGGNLLGGCPGCASQQKQSRASSQS